MPSQGLILGRIGLTKIIRTVAPNNTTITKANREVAVSVQVEAVEIVTVAPEVVRSTVMEVKAVHRVARTVKAEAMSVGVIAVATHLQCSILP